MKTFDLLIRGGTVIDGTRRPRFDADVGVDGGRIVLVGDARGTRAAREIDARGRIVAPGFIDCHTHDDLALLTQPDMAFKVSQGVTAVVTGNCGVSVAPVPRPLPRPIPAPLDLLDTDAAGMNFPSFASWVGALADAPPAVNVAALVGHTTLRAAVMDRCDRRATEAEIAAMQALAKEAAQAGAIGGSSGLYYEGARAADADEVVAALAPFARRGVYCAHIRDEGARVLEAMDETFRIGRELGVTTVLSHHKVMGLPNHGRSTQTLAHLEQTMQGQSVCLDCYPYAASSTVLTMDRAAVASRTLIASSRPLPQYAGRDLDDVARELGVTPAQAVERLLPASAIYFAMDEADVRRILAFGPTMIGSDGIPLGARPHPRLWGTFPRVLGHYSRKLGLFPLETAVHKMTGLTASNFGLDGRGVVRTGAHADLVVFDAERIEDRADFDASTRPAAGIDAVLVAGRVVWRDGTATGERPGTLIRGAAAAD